MSRTDRSARSSKWRTVHLLTVVTAITAQYSSGHPQSAACLQTLRATATTLLFKNMCNGTEGTNIDFQYKKSSDSIWKSVLPSEKTYYIQHLDPDTKYDARILKPHINTEVQNVTSSTCKSRPPPLRGIKQVPRGRRTLFVDNRVRFSENPQCKRYFKIRYQVEGSKFTEWKEYCKNTQNEQYTSANSYHCSPSFLLKSIEEGKYYNIEMLTVRLGAENETSEVVKVRALAGPITPATAPASRTPQASGLRAGNNTTQLPPSPVEDSSGSLNATQHIPTSSIPPSTNQLSSVVLLVQDSRATQNADVSPTVWFIVILTSAALMGIVALPRPRCFSKRARLNIQSDTSNFRGGNSKETDLKGNNVMSGTGTERSQFTNKCNATISPHGGIQKSTPSKGLNEKPTIPSEMEYAEVYADRYLPPVRMESGSMPKNATIHRGTYRREPNMKPKPKKVALPLEEVSYENMPKKVALPLEEVSYENMPKILNNMARNDTKMKQSLNPAQNLEPNDYQYLEVVSETTLETAGIQQRNEEIWPARPEENTYENSIRGMFPPGFRFESSSASMVSSSFPSPEVSEMIQDEASSFVYLNVSNFNPTSEGNNEHTYDNIGNTRKY